MSSAGGGGPDALVGTGGGENLYLSDAIPVTKNLPNSCAHISKSHGEQSRTILCRLNPSRKGPAGGFHFQKNHHDYQCINSKYPFQLKPPFSYFLKWHRRSTVPLNFHN